MSSFWIYMLVVVALIPVSMLLISRWFKKGGPQEINGISGYRTKRSMQNIDTWRFAHTYCGALLERVSVVALPVSVVVMVAVRTAGENFFALVAMVLTAAQLVSLFVCVALTERALKQRFSQAGKPRA
ncbi:MAG: SdpI family protein [Atopobiaceae bacterium]|jgi:uncharacterized membrane protein